MEFKKLNVIHLKVSDLIAYENNPRKNDDAVDAVASSIKSFGFNLIGQMMIGLPSSTLKTEVETAEYIASIADGARIYPTVVFKNTELCDLYDAGDYHPLTEDDAIVMFGQLKDGSNGDEGMKYLSKLTVNNVGGEVEYKDNKIIVRNADRLTLIFSSANSRSVNICSYTFVYGILGVFVASSLVTAAVCTGMSPYILTKEKYDTALMNLASASISSLKD